MCASAEESYAEYDYSGYYQTSRDYDVLHTGDPLQDLEYSQQYQSDYIVPEVIKNFLIFFQKSIDVNDMSEILNCYENGFNKLTDRFFKNSAWPEAYMIAHIVENDSTFLILYKELFFRHVYARIANGPTLDQRFASYKNYCDVFNYILSAQSPVPLELPNQWLWDIVDEFIYQIWNVHSVLNVLHSLIEKSSINRQLDVSASGGDPDSVSGLFGKSYLYKMLGYFSLIGLLRLHCLLGDYHQALKVIEKMDFTKKSLFSRVPVRCHITISYHIGFAYMMMRRYQDAIRTLSNILLYIHRTKQVFQNQPSLYDQINKNNDKMFTMLAICLVLHPMRIDETLHSHLRDNHLDSQTRMQKGDLAEFEQCFLYCCPKFLSPATPNYDTMPENYHRGPFKLQLHVFLDEVQQQIMIPTIRSFLKLYTTLPTPKLALFMCTNEEQICTQLMCFKDMIHIADTKVARRYGDYFIRQIHKLDDICRNLRQIGASEN